MKKPRRPQGNWLGRHGRFC